MRKKLIVALSVVVLVFGLLPIDPVFSNEAPQAYGVRVVESNWTQAYQLVNVLLRSGVPVYLAAESFDVDGVAFEPGDFLIPVSAMPIEETALDVGEAEGLVVYLSQELDVDVVPIVDEIEVDVYVLKPINIALYGGQSGLPTPYSEVFSTLGFRVEYVSENEIKVGRLISDGYDVLAVPGDGSTGELVALGEDGGAAVQEFVANGGGYISSCAGSWAGAMGSLGWDESYYLQLINAKNWNVVEGYAGAFRKLYPGKGVMVFENINPGHPVMWGIPETFEMVWWQGPIFEIVSSTLEYPSTAEGLVVNQGFTDSFTAAEYYSDLPKQKREGFKDTIVYTAISQKRPVVVSGTYGKGRVVLFGPHPEFVTELTLDGFQYVPARMIANALLWEASNGPYVFTTQSVVSSLTSNLSPLTPSRYTRVVESVAVYRFGLDRVLADEEAILGKAEQLNQMYVENSNPGWLSGLQSSWGLTPKEEFEYNIQEIPMLCVELETACVYTNQIVAGLMSAYADLSSLENGLSELGVRFNVEDLLDEVREAKVRVVYSLHLINEGISMVQGPTVTYGGTEGVLDLTSKAVVKMDTAIANYGAKKTTSATEPLANIGTYGAAGCIVHALNTLRGMSSYANGELGYAGYTVEKVAYELAGLRTLVTNEDVMESMEDLKAADEELMGKTEELKAGNEDLKRRIEESTELLEKQISQVYVYATVVGIVSAIVTSAVIYVLMKWKKVV